MTKIKNFLFLKNLTKGFTKGLANSDPLLNLKHLEHLEHLEFFQWRGKISLLLIGFLACFSLQCTSNDSVNSVSAPYAEEVEELGEDEEASLAAELGEEGESEASGDLPEGELADNEMEGEALEGVKEGALEEDSAFAEGTGEGADSDSDFSEVASESASASSDHGGSTHSTSTVQGSRISVKKIKDTPFFRAGVWVNAVYILRSQDTLKKVSQKIYRQDRTRELLAINPHLRATTKAGNKVYYNSPYRPMDKKKLLFYYEDKGLSPSFYVTRPKDNLRKVAKRLLGFSGAWKEIWAINPQVQSKWEVASGMELRYWVRERGGSGASTSGPLASVDSSSPSQAFPEPMPIGGIEMDPVAGNKVACRISLLPCLPEE